MRPYTIAVAKNDNDPSASQYTISDYDQEDLMSHLEETFGSQSIHDQAVLHDQHRSYYVIATKTPHMMSLKINPFSGYNGWIVFEGSVPGDPFNRTVAYEVSPSNLLGIITGVDMHHGVLSPQRYVLTSRGRHISLSYHH
jgi:hypothetical protein